MKFLHTAFFLLLVANFLSAQVLQVVPAEGNPILKHHANQKALENAMLVEQLTGHYPQSNFGEERATCPPDVDGYIVETGRSIEIEIDTFGLTQGDDNAVFTIENSSALQFGTANFLDSILLLTYVANGGLTGANTENIQLKISQPGHDTTITVEIKVRRRGRVVVTETQTVQPESITTFCLEDELEFDLPKACAGSRDEFDNYDGRGAIIHHLSSYDYPDTCLVYYASRFPGVDTISMTICDEWGVCDLFKVPYLIPGDTLSIQSQPFFDDFASYDGVYPTRDLWLDKDVYRNTTLAKDPPSVGFVSFDGLDSRGDVYNVNEGVGDRLTSKAIDLSGFNASNNVSLRFFIAPKGYGLAPEESDSLYVEFRNNQREWVKVDSTFYGLKDTSISYFPPFEFKGIAIKDPQFLHDAFQFRFTAVTSPGGIGDMWHVDYIVLSQNATPSNQNFVDIAFTRLPSSILKNYTSLPWRHFKNHVADEVTNAYNVGFFNHKDAPENLDGSILNIVETTVPKDFDLDISISETGDNIPSRMPFTRSGTIPQAKFDGLVSDLAAISTADFRNINTKLYFNFTGQPLSAFYFNDTIELNTPFSNYFAHDDGTAEWQIFMQHATGIEQFGSKFHTNVEDELKAVQFMFPHVNGDVSNQLFNLNIWLGDFDTLIFSRPLLKPLYPSLVYDTLQGFTTYLLDDFDGNPMPITIPANTDFYVTLQQESSVALGIPIGFDVQNPCNCNWVNLTGNKDDWKEFPSSLAGALMIRPVFGDIKATSGNNEISKVPTVNIYPNPTKGVVQFDVDESDLVDYKVSIYNSIGQLMTQGAMRRNLDLGAFPNGIYFLNITNEKSGIQTTKRIVLAKD